MPPAEPSYAAAEPSPVEPSPATLGRRVLALAIDWITCLAIVEGMVAVGVLAGNPNGVGTLALFVVETALFTAVMGGSFGKLATRLRVVRTDGSGQPPSLLRSIVRAVLVALVIPAVLRTEDGRGLHDIAAGTRAVAL